MNQPHVPEANVPKDTATTDCGNYSLHHQKLRTSSGRQQRQRRQQRRQRCSVIGLFRAMATTILFGRLLESSSSLVRPTQGLVSLTITTVAQKMACCLGRGNGPSSVAAVRTFPTTTTTKTTTTTATKTTRLQSTNGGAYNMDDFEEALHNDQAYRRPVLQWYPGHIAKAERQLQETIKAVDVVLEVRDARIPQATQHPSIPTWCAGKPRIAVMTHLDVVPRDALNVWKRAIQNEEHYGIVDKQIQHQADQALRERIKYEMPNHREDDGDSTMMTAAAETTAAAIASSTSALMTVCCVDAKHGEGIMALKKVIQKTGQYVHARRQARGLLARPLRVGILGYPNTGKSALINRIVNRKRARTANTPGVTRSLQWIRIKGDTDFELLDSPGIIPASLDNQEYAKLLAVCNCIGAAAYDTQAMAAFCCERLLHGMTPSQSALYAPDWHRLFLERYKVPPTGTGEDMLFAVANATCRGSPEDAARKILKDARTGRMGPICWEVAPTFGGPDDPADDEEIVSSDRRYQKDSNAAAAAAAARLERQRIGQQAREAAQNRGVELPTISDVKDVGKGLFDGW